MYKRRAKMCIYYFKFSLFMRSFLLYNDDIELRELLCNRAIRRHQLGAESRSCLHDKAFEKREEDRYGEICGSMLPGTEDPKCLERKGRQMVFLCC